MYLYETLREDAARVDAMMEMVFWGITILKNIKEAGMVVCERDKGI